jgi:hypothetical protein
MTDDDWFAYDEGMQFPRTRREIARENRAQHDILQPHGYAYCRTCGKIGSLLREPCALPIDLMKEIRAEADEWLCDAMGRPADFL